MIEHEVAVAGVVLVVTVGVGLIAHEWSHAIVLRLGNVEYDVSYFPEHSDGVVGALASYPWAVVEPTDAPDVTTWVLRLAALAPLALSSPVLVLAMSGIVPDDSPLVAAFAIGSLACALPSPQDFSVAFYAHRQRRNCSSESHSLTGGDDESAYSRISECEPRSRSER